MQNGNKDKIFDLFYITKLNDEKKLLDFLLVAILKVQQI